MSGAATNFPKPGDTWDYPGMALVRVTDIMDPGISARTRVFKG